MTERNNNPTSDAFEEIVRNLMAEDEAAWRRWRRLTRIPSLAAQLATLVGVFVLVASLSWPADWWTAWVGGVGFTAAVLGVAKLLEIHSDRVGLWRERRIRALLRRLSRNHR